MTNREILERANARISRGDFEGFLEACTDDTTWNFVGDRVLTGKDAVRRWMTDTYVHPPQNEVERMISDGEFLAVYGVVTVTAADGTSTSSPYCDVWRFEGGKLAELRAFVIA